MPRYHLTAAKGSIQSDKLMDLIDWQCEHQSAFCAIQDRGPVTVSVDDVDFSGDKDAIRDKIVALIADE